jgi:predicted acylesterase/phospholipase RssA
MSIDVSKMTKINAYNLFSKLGLDDGQRFEIVLKKFFKAKSIDPGITFSELYKMTHKTLIVTGSCINDKKVYYFSHDTHPNMKVVDALRISISVPIFYTPRKYKGKVFLDGGCIDNYPMALFQHKLQKVIGIYVAEHREHVDKINSIESFLLNTIGCVREGMDINARKGFEDRTIYIKCASGEDNNHISAMFDQGYVTAAEFFTGSAAMK